MSRAAQPSVCVKVLRAPIATAATLGLAPADALRILGVSPELLADPAARVPHELLVRAWTEIPGKVGHPTFGLAAAEITVKSSFDVVDHALSHCATLRDGLDALIRYQRLLHDANDVRVEQQSGGLVCVSQRLRVPGDVPDHLSDFIAAQWVLRSEVLTGQPARFTRIELTRPMPADVSEHRRIFPAAIAFGAARNALWIEAGSLRTPIVRADPSLSAVLRRHADDLLAALPPSNSLATALHRHLLGTLESGPPDVQRAASAIGVSTRTLQRKLEEEGTSFKAVLDDARRTLAVSYLRDGSRTVSEVAFLVGFSEVSAFSRAFRRWTGQSAVSYRKVQAAGQHQV
jgi:AraC-like DNA-binding protein